MIHVTTLLAYFCAAVMTSASAFIDLLGASRFSGTELEGPDDKKKGGVCLEYIQIIGTPSDQGNLDFSSTLVSSASIWIRMHGGSQPMQ